MNITFNGAACGVTGSNHLVEIAGKKILLDCGMYQGGRESEKKNHEDFSYDVHNIDAVLISHAHLDHTGRIPKLIRDGYSGPIYMTEGTKELAMIILEDAVRIMEEKEKKWKVPMIYTLSDVKKIETVFKSVTYQTKIEILPGIFATWKDAGHILGSAFIEIISEEGSLGFSGDIGNNNVPILKETDKLGDVDILLIESTYGNRIHERQEKKKLLLTHILESVKSGGTIMMPSFSIERTQEILYYLDELSEEGLLPNIPIFLDSPMAIRAIPVYKKHKEYYDRAACEKLQKGHDFLEFPNLKLTETVPDSKSINFVSGSKMIIAGSGMMSGGRILHHAMRYLSDPKSTLIFVGYQAEGTLGRKIYDGAEVVNIYHKDIPVRCTIKAIGALSAHGDQTKLLSWVKNADKLPKKVFCIHGETIAADTLADKLKDDLGIEAIVPEPGDSFDV
jgi:metallo-beta-lactamase family protein